MNNNMKKNKKKSVRMYLKNEIHKNQMTLNLNVSYVIFLKSEAHMVKCSNIFR